MSGTLYVDYGTTCREVLKGITYIIEDAHISHAVSTVVPYARRLTDILHRKQVICPDKQDNAKKNQTVHFPLSHDKVGFIAFILHAANQS